MELITRLINSMGGHLLDRLMRGVKEITLLTLEGVPALKRGPCAWILIRKRAFAASNNLSMHLKSHKALMRALDRAVKRILRLHLSATEL